MLYTYCNLRNYTHVKVEGELNKICERLLTLLDTHMLQGDVSDNPEQVEGRVFYQKMKGDYYRYMAEYSSGNDKSEHETNAATAYQQAVDKAADLAPTHPIRLGLALNFSVFHYEIQNKPNEACALAKQAFDDAIAELDTLSEESYKDATLIMQVRESYMYTKILQV